jgi:hypothetical protein
MGLEFQMHFPRKDVEPLILSGSVNYHRSRMSEKRTKGVKTALRGSREGEGLPDEKKKHTEIEEKRPVASLACDLWQWTKF